MVRNIIGTLLDIGISKYEPYHIDYLIKSLGFNVSINTRKDKKDIFRLTATVNKQRKNPNCFSVTIN